MSNEITVKLQCSVNEVCKLLESKNFKVTEKYTLNDTYFVPSNLNLSKMDCRNILKNAVILREIIDFETHKRIIKLTYKVKNIDDEGNILNQEKYNCEIKDNTQGKTFLEAVGYKKLFEIKEKDTVYKNKNLEIAIKEVEDENSLIEIETNDTLDTIEKLIQELEKLDIPYDKSNYFVKKAEIKLKKVLGE